MEEDITLKTVIRFCYLFLSFGGENRKIMHAAYYFIDCYFLP